MIIYLLIRVFAIVYDALIFVSCVNNDRYHTLSDLSISKVETFIKSFKFFNWNVLTVLKNKKLTRLVGWVWLCLPLQLHTFLQSSVCQAVRQVWVTYLSPSQTDWSRRQNTHRLVCTQPSSWLILHQPRYCITTRLEIRHAYLTMALNHYQPQKAKRTDRFYLVTALLHKLYTWHTYLKCLASPVRLAVPPRIDWSFWKILRRMLSYFNWHSKTRTRQWTIM